MSKSLELNDLFNSSSSIKKKPQKAPVPEEDYNVGGEVIEEIPDDFDSEFEDMEEMQIPDDMDADSSEMYDDDDAMEAPVSVPETEDASGDDFDDETERSNDNEDEVEPADEADNDFDEYDSDENEKHKRDKAARNIVNGITQNLLSRGKGRPLSESSQQTDEPEEDENYEDYSEEVDGTYDPNYDHYYDDVLPEIEAEIQRIDAWMLLKAGGVVALLFLIIAYFIFYI